MSNKTTFLPLMIRLIIFCILVCCSIFTEQAASQTDRIEGRRQEQKESADAGCLANDKPKPDVTFRLGILNGKAMKMPKPIYPVEAKRKGITGEVKAEVVININTGVIEWARIQTGAVILREAVGKVICGARFLPTNDVDGRASGYLIYNFHSPRKAS
jgi:outer membrane biosynthesis protein TonB